MIVEVWAEIENLPEAQRQIGWVSFVGRSGDHRRHLSRALRVGPWRPDADVPLERARTRQTFAGAAYPVIKTPRGPVRYR